MTDQQTKKHSISDLESLYMAAEEADRELFAEQRSNILLYAGEHYNKLRSNFYKRLRDVKALTEEQRLRLTKNHTQKIVDSYTNHIMSTAPGTGFEPANESELKDQKAAELNRAIWQALKEKFGLDEDTQDECEDFTQIGEVACKITWDHNAGTLQEGFDEFGQPVQQYSGDIVFEEIYGFNLLVDPSATKAKNAKWMCIRKMIDISKALSMFPDPENKKYLQESAEQTYTIFDRGKAGFQKTKNQCLLKEMFFRPCHEYPNGYFYFFVKDKILAEGELPFGLFPIVYKGFRNLKTRPRAQSIVKTIRPFQAEINRAASKMAEHQITLGDDKVLIQNGTQLTSGRVLAGIRSYNYTGIEPKILPGRDGAQYASYLAQQITEMYNAVDVDEKEEPLNGQVDPYALLYRSGKQKKKFKLYVGRFEQYLIEKTKLALEIMRRYAPDEMLAQMIGADEVGNIEEFRSMEQLCYKIKIVAQSDDLETKLGKQLVLSQTLQYTASKFEREDIGKLIKAMPYSNMGESFNDLTIDYEAATNDILALDRGLTPPISEFDNHIYMIKRLTQRMRQADFERMPDQIKINYMMRLQKHQQIQAEQVKALQRAQAGLIPTTGYLVSCDFYIQVPNSTGGTKDKRVRLPSGALIWLIDQLGAQGQTLDEIEKLGQGNQAQIANMVGGANGMGPSNPAEEMAKGMTNGSANGTTLG